MIYELPVSVANNSLKVFLQENFSVAVTANSPMHKHSYMEVHIVYDGQVELAMSDRVYNLSAGDVIVIPANCFHWRNVKSENAKCFAFSVNMDAEKISVKQLDKNLLKAFAKEIDESRGIENLNIISAFISLFWCYIFNENSLDIVETSDYSYVINKFFEDNYSKDITLKDLANELSLSEKQVSRLVHKYTGNNFRTEITKRRVTAARILMKSSNLSKTEIAEQLGYTSYSCLWKAMKTFKEENIK